MYELLDFGEGRRLERFGELVLDRPSPAAEGTAKAAPRLWSRADARFERTDEGPGGWIEREGLPARWIVRYGDFALELKRTEFGHLGVFPEQSVNWAWIAERVREAAKPVRVLNLFAYTGGSTLAAASAGACVTHVDAAKNVVAWARRNAEASGLTDAPIRWIAEDAMKFVRREVRRGNDYDAVILDPPSYGHGTRGEVWRLEEHLPELLELCGRLTAGRCRFVLLTCHTPDYDAERLMRTANETMRLGRRGRWTGGPLSLRTSAGRELPSGVGAAWCAPPDLANEPV